MFIIRVFLVILLLDIDLLALEAFLEFLFLFFVIFISFNFDFKFFFFFCCAIYTNPMINSSNKIIYLSGRPIVHPTKLMIEDHIYKVS